jgi:hypothetical protein
LKNVLDQIIGSRVFTDGTSHLVYRDDQGQYVSGKGDSNPCLLAENQTADAANHSAEARTLSAEELHAPRETGNRDCFSALSVSAGLQRQFIALIEGAIPAHAIGRARTCRPLSRMRVPGNQ